MATIHIVDDDRSYAYALANAIEYYAFRAVVYLHPSQVAGIVVGDADCFLIDVYFPDGNGVDLLQSLRHYKVPIVLMSNAATVPLSVQAMKFGADDFIEKRDGVGAVVDSLLTVLASGQVRVTTPDSRCLDCLTTQEKVVLIELQKGDSSKVIAKNLCLSPRTIEGHRSSILRKLGVKTVVELICRSKF